MAKKLSEEARKSIDDLYEKGLPVSDIADRTGISYPIIYSHTKLRERGFESCSEYKEHLAKKKGFESYHEYLEYLTIKNGFKSVKEYQEHLAVKNGYDSFNDYNNQMAKQRQQRPENQMLGILIEWGLKKIGKNQTWLAEQLGTTRQTVSSYRNGKTFPKEPMLEKMCSVLDVPSSAQQSLLELKIS
ncbi:helix-turn-helix domain-containing protein [Candidatus Woesearchaeota archaeon]|nr:helix-turn-helix domain-containing protein [Candidatus Woesearchaeota archaeon]